MNFLNFLFPRKCLGCGKKGVYFCPSCKKEIISLDPQVSLRESPLDILISVFPYQGIIRQAILKLKYNFVSDLADELADLTVRLIEQENLDCLSGQTLAPIPLHWYRKNWRGFNQTEILGEKLAQRLKINFCSDLLIRVRPTEPQVKLKEKKRKKNVKGAFKRNPRNQLPSTNYLLFDDVWTTGATMNECARVLKRAGAKKVFGLTLAR